MIEMNGIESMLDRDESIVWDGKPSSGIIFRAKDAFILPVATIWVAAAIYIEVTLISKNAPVWSILLILVFILFGLFFAVGRLYLYSYRRSKTKYALTTRRAIICMGNRQPVSIYLSEIKSVRLIESVSGRGTIVFADVTELDMFTYPGIESMPQFEAIADAKAVCEKILSLKPR